MSDSGAPASTRARRPPWVRGVVFGWATSRVHDDAGHEKRRQGAVTIVQRRTESQREQCRHIAGRGRSGSIQSASPRSSFEAW